MKARLKSFRWKRVALIGVLLMLPVAAFAATACCCGCPFCCLFC